ncbi:hypothetical protein RND71_024014 [Anisodus tanguticus]|uniref:SMP-30/Gluconolactonase/LRE-like region domain-containing protein n=1 Tax=Anisodus tanguticus TaxID=243964 RepID=A0AAE1VEF4_9SOLA|nr:hypothetical protein RND71_024014 [Anisodus tanguticus]
MKFITLLSTLFILIALLVPSTAKKRHIINFRSPNLFPESFTWDPKSQHFIVGSTRHHKILAVSDAGVVETLISDTSLPLNSYYLGLAIDRHTNRLLACIHRPPSPENSSPFNALASYDLQSRRRLFLARLLDENIEMVTEDAVQSTSAVAKDVAVDYSGDAYVTNSGDDFIWKVDVNGDVSILSKSKAYKSHPADATTDYHKTGLNGIVYSFRGYLLVVQSNTGKLFKVNVDDGIARAVTLNKNLTGANGIAVRKDGVVLVVSKHKLYFLKSDDGWGQGGVFDETALKAERSPTAVIVGDEKRVYVLYGHVNEGKMGNEEREEFSIVEVESELENLEEPIWLYILIGLGLTYFMFWRFQMHRLVETLNKKTV